MNEGDLPVVVYSKHLVQPRLDVYYPVVSGMTHPAVQQQINNTILNLVYKMIRDQGYYQNPLAQVTGTFELKTNERGIFSLTIINYTFAGGAHGNTVVKSLTFDVATGKVYTLKELFKPNADYVRRLSEIISRQIAERQIQLLDGFTSIKPDQDYYIGDKSLVIYFQLYELAAYVFGILYFPISVYQIQDIIDENGPLGRMMY